MCSTKSILKLRPCDSSNGISDQVVVPPSCSRTLQQMWGKPHPLCICASNRLQVPIDCTEPVISHNRFRGTGEPLRIQPQEPGKHIHRWQWRRIVVVIVVVLVLSKQLDQLCLSLNNLLYVWWYSIAIVVSSCCIACSIMPRRHLVGKHRRVIDIIGPKTMYI